MEYVFTAEGISKKYGKIFALKDFDMKIPEGSIYGFIGKNGAGKTTLIRIITGLQKPEEGNFSLFSVKNTDKEIGKARRRTGAVIETPAFNPEMNAEDNLKQQAIISGLPSFDFIPDLLKEVGLSDAGKKPAGKFSLGMKQRLGIAVALTGNPDFLILDEPMNGLDPQGIVTVRELILSLNRSRQVTVLISSHMLDELSKLATYYGFIDKGKMIKEISADELEKTLKKRTETEVSDISVFAEVLDSMGLQYEIISDRKAYIFGNFSLSGLIIKLKEKNCEVLSISEKDETLESYFVNLSGGEHNA